MEWAAQKVQGLYKVPPQHTILQSTTYNYKYVQTLATVHKITQQLQIQKIY